jgi:hypothetical protein
VVSLLSGGVAKVTEFLEKNIRQLCSRKWINRTRYSAQLSFPYIWKEELMAGDNKIGEISGFQLRINDSTVLVRFSRNADQDVRTKVRDILTEAYEERFQQGISAYAKSL